MSNKGKNNVSKREQSRRRRGKGLQTLVPQGYAGVGTFETFDPKKAALRDMTPEEIDTGVITDIPEPKFVHVDEFIDNRFLMEDRRDPLTHYARWMFAHFRLSASDRMDFDQFMVGHELYCMFEGEKHRVVGASRLGDVWLTLDFSSTSYQKRVEITGCTEWSKE